MKLKDIKTHSIGEHAADPREQERDITPKEEEESLADLLSDDGNESVPLHEVRSEDILKKNYEVQRQTSSQQGIINLLGVDANRVAEFASRTYLFLGIFISFSVATTALVRLIGWVPFGLGLLAPFILMPLNMLASRAYGRAQAGLMMHRDEKVVAATEALQGIRQIKLSATERQWQERIMRAREAELEQQKKVFMWTIILRLFWISSPILLSVISLASYSWIHGSLSPSVAFTSIAVFGNLEVALSVIPFALTQGFDAFVSCSRIENLLDEEDREEIRVPGEDIMFENASISWSNTKQASRQRTVSPLKNLNAQFPRGELR